MPGAGRWHDDFPKERAGHYIETLSTRPVEPPAGYRGIVLFPLLNANWGPDREFFTIEAKDYNAQKALVGIDLDYINKDTIPFREALNYAKELLCYRVGTPGTKAKADAIPMTAPAQPEPAEGEAVTPAPTGPFELKATAKYGGTRGNDLRFSIVANPDGGFNVTIYLEGETLSRLEGVETVEDLVAANSPWITFEGSGQLVPVAGVNLTGGENGEVTNYDVSQFLDQAEQKRWNTLVFPVDGRSEDDSVQALLRMVDSKIIYLRDQVGLSRRAVMVHHAANHEAIFNATTGGYDADGLDYNPCVFACWYAGADSAVSKTTSMTNTRWKSITEVYPKITNAEIEARLKRGELMVTLGQDNNPVVEKDRNSLTDFDRPRDSSWSKGRVIRTLDALRDEIQRRLPPNKFDNDDAGYDAVDATGKTLLLEFQLDHALKNVDQDNDFKIDRERSADDSAFIDVGAEPVDSIEKYYTTIRTR